tara:strand:+ start:1135 stop:1713 length:579 start_codon:yes stop_codon:yes gene_type:complete
MDSIKISSKKDFLMISLNKFYKINNNLNILKPIISGKSNISLRILDWFITNYSKKFFTSYENKNIKNINNTFMVYINYKSQLKAYSKKQFDPFCRRERIIIKDNNGNDITTTVGQLNFFRWAIENQVIDFINKNIKKIEKDMVESLGIYKKSGKKNKKDKKEKKERRKRKELSISASKTIKKHNISIVVNFD